MSSKQSIKTSFNQFCVFTNEDFNQFYTGVLEGTYVTESLENEDRELRNNHIGSRNVLLLLLTYFRIQTAFTQEKHRQK